MRGKGSRKRHNKNVAEKVLLSLQKTSEYRDCRDSNANQKQGNRTLFQALFAVIFFKSNKSH